MLQLPKLYQNEMEMAYITVTGFQSIDRYIECLLFLTIGILLQPKTSESSCVKMVSVEGKVPADLKYKLVEVCT